MKYRVVVLEDYLNLFIQMPEVKKLRTRKDVELTICTDKASEEVIINRIQNADIVITIRDRIHFTQKLLTSIKHIKLLSVCGSRLDHIDIAAAKSNGIQISAPTLEQQGYKAYTDTCELTWGLILSLTKNLLLNDKNTRAGKWQKCLSSSLSDLTLGLIGFGNVGKNVAKVASAFGMKVIAWSPNLTPSRIQQSNVKIKSFKELLKMSDIISLHLPLTCESKQLIDRNAFKLMKKSALLINTSRGNIIDENALKWALENQIIAGVGLDVFWDEPLISTHWINKFSNAVLQPHMGAGTKSGGLAILKTGVQQVLDFLEGNLCIGVS